MRAARILNATDLRVGAGKDADGQCLLQLKLRRGGLVLAASPPLREQLRAARARS